MARTLPSVVVQALFAQSTSIPFFVLLVASHSSFATIRVVNNTQAIISNGQTYVPFPFTVLLPPESEDLLARVQIRLFDVQREIIDNLRVVAGSRERIAIRLLVIANNDPDTVLQTISGYEIENVGYTAGNITIDASIENLVNEGFPRDSFSPDNFPGLF